MVDIFEHEYNAFRPDLVLLPHGVDFDQDHVACFRAAFAAAIPAPDQEQLDANLLTLGQATKYCRVSDTTLMRLIDENLLAVEQVAPYAPLEIKRADLDSEPVASILERLRATGKLILDGDTLQQCLFD
ncbi:MAG: hypothetical protein ACRED0_09255 [Gammaproteobacteria bacterium]